MTGDLAVPDGSWQVVVMGVSGSGKSTVGAALAARIGAPFVDGDDLHSPASIAKMAASVPLSDVDRTPWLDAVGELLAESTRPGTVVACSALKRTYRDRIRAHAPAAFFLELCVPSAVLGRRMEARDDHFMPVSLLESQIRTLEPLAPEEAGLRVDATRSVAGIVEEVLGPVLSR